MKNHLILQVLLVTLVFNNGFSQIKKENKLLIGRIELSNNNYQQAIESFNLASTNEPLNYEPYYYKAIAKMELGDLFGALSDNNKAIELEPRNVDLYILRGSINDRQLNYQKAFEDYSKALSIDNKNPDIYLSRAITYSNLEDYNNAINDCESAIRYRSRKELIYLIRGMSELGLKNYRKAIIDFNIIIDNSPNNATNYVRRASAYYYLNSYDSALTDIHRALILDNKNSYAFFQRAMIFSKLNKTDEALSDLNQLIQLSPNSSSAYYNRALILSEKGNFKASIKDYDKVININNKNILAYYNRAIIYQRLKKYREAKADIEKSITLYPDFVDAYKVRATIKQALGDYKGAENDNQTAQIINRSKINITDSLKHAEELFISKITSFSNGNQTVESSNFSKTKTISVLPDYYIQTISNLNEKRIVDSWNNTKKTFTSYFLIPSNQLETNLEQVFNTNLQQVNREIEMNTNDAEFYLKRAILYSSIKNFKNALADFDLSINLDSTNYIAYFCKANFIHLILSTKDTFTNKYSIIDTYANYSKCIEKNPNFCFAYFNSGNLKFQEEKYIEAIEFYTKAIKVNSSFADAYYNRALILLILENREQACADLSKAGELGFLPAYEVIAKYCN